MTWFWKNMEILLFHVNEHVGLKSTPQPLSTGYFWSLLLSSLPAVWLGSAHHVVLSKHTEEQQDGCL